MPGQEDEEPNRWENEWIGAHRGALVREEYRMPRQEERWVGAQRGALGQEECWMPGQEEYEECTGAGEVLDAWAGG